MYPAYRKYKDRDVWFEITSGDLFFEVSRMGTKFLISEVKAVQYPEKLRIMDMMACLNEAWEKISAAEYAAVRQKVTF
jgi:hypothetical protein